MQLTTLAAVLSLAAFGAAQTSQVPCQNGKCPSDTDGMELSAVVCLGSEC